MATLNELIDLHRLERFTRLVAAFNAAERWELYRTAGLYWTRLVQLGARMNEDGCWQLDDPPAAGNSNSYKGE